MAPPTAEETKQAAAAAKLAETAGAVTEVLERQLKIKELLAAAGVEENEAIQESLKLQTEVLKNQAQVKQALKNEMDLRKALAEEEQQIAELRGAMSQFEIDQSFAKIEALEAELDLIPGIIDGHNEAIIQNKELIGLIDEKTRAEKKYGDNLKQTLNDAEKASTRVSDAFAEFASGLPVIGNSLRQVFNMKGKALKLGKTLEGLGGNYAKLGTKITKFATGISVASMAVFAIILAAAAMALQFDNLSKEIGRATGLGDKFNQTLNNGYRQTILSGVSMKEYAGAVTSLANNFSGFNPTAQKTNQYLATTTSRLEKLGVSADSSSKLMDHFHRAMGLSQKAAADMTAQLVMLGREVGITTSKMAADFQASAGVLARYGKDQIKVFKQLAAQIKGTGLEMGTLLNMASKFDNFDTAADSVGNLNAVLGTQLSTIELMAMSEADRVKTIKEQVQASVGNFDSLDKFTKMHIAQAMGLKDVAEAQRLLNMSQSETAANAAKMQEQADIQAELAAATAELVPMMQKLKLIGMKIFMVFSPLISAFTGLFEGLDILYEKMAGVSQGMDDLSKLGDVLKVVFIALGAGLLFFAGVIGWPLTLIIALGAAFGVVYEWLTKSQSPSMASGLFGYIAADLGLFGVVVQALFLPLTLVVRAISKLWDILHLSGSSDMANGLFTDIGKDVDFMTGLLQLAGFTVATVANSFTALWEAMHAKPGDAIDVNAMANIDTSKVAAGWNEIKSAVMELSNIKMDGFLAMHTTGDSSSFVMGSDGLIKSISEGKLIVDVKMPEMKLPEVLVKVFIGDRELKSIIKTEVQAQVGAMG